ncbi:2-C-methyl-D-erythritol 4-phosphate cytidylyltransferase 1 [Leuconostoc citreum LBAE E16]|uniref:IspD/TarI family cytidylyltransferase n=1 Tax=Leuconostoc citreum TaxID=33964 RepID=UPI0002465D78|nr:2-C-methyl-D-erythritol 4-phosphate cytidylyltransferase 1 [Leuconostoc citreum LBAE E16]
MKYDNVVLIFAGGVGSRMNNGSLPKQFLEVENKPIIIHTLEIFEKSQYIDGIFISITPGWENFLDELTKKYNLQKVVKIVEGGETSQISQFNALKTMAEFVNDQTTVLIHDGVRPLIDNEVIKNNINSVTKHGNAITVKKAIETVITVTNDNQVDQVLNRDDYRMAVAPQSYHYKDIFSAHSKAEESGKVDFVDSAQLMQSFGKKLFYVDGTTNNIKITTPIDYYIFKGILEARRVNQIF